ncbi:MAG: Uncharacterised protein [Flavobacteriia bacterium]|nr:MAG: Uncharacterised protein [Flavobacteriia bacterium]
MSAFVLDARQDGWGRVDFQPFFLQLLQCRCVYIFDLDGQHLTFSAKSQNGLLVQKAALLELQCDARTGTMRIRIHHSCLDIHSDGLLQQHLSKLSATEYPQFS